MTALTPTTLAEVCESVRYGYTASASDDPVGPRFLRITDIVPDSLDWQSVPYCAIDDEGRERFALVPGDIVVARTGATVGYAKLIRHPVDAVFASYLVRFRVDSAKAEPFFVGRLVESAAYKAFVQSRIGGAAQPNASAPVLGSFAFTLPDMKVQRRIADILSAYDVLIENNRRRMALLEDAARQLYQEWFVRLRFPGHEHTRITDGVPERWEWATLAQVCTERDGIQTGPFGSQLHQSDYTEDGVPVVMPKDLIDFRISETSIARISEDLANRLGRHRMQRGDTVYGRRGDIGRRAFIGRRQAGWFCGTGCLRIRPDDARVNARYLCDMLGSPAVVATIANRAKGSTMPNLSAGALKSVPLLLAPRPLQDDYASRVGAYVELRETLSEQNAKLRTARDLLLPRLMNGEMAI